ncbi:DUF1398 domain-containing protein [Schlesneria sp. T3-172]|uniref:DUF1398 domain-containing protein n=1 Tax=Schlesneria sphaerica TaxID=3373610 RepID=UPI0037C80A07
MDDQKAQVMRECAAGSGSGELTFPEIVGRLMDIGVERYHADYSRQEITYYLPSGQSLVVASPHEPFPTGGEFLVAAVQDAVGQSQRNEHSYCDFVRKTMAAGCVGYFVQISGRRVIYFGRNGESHVEHFPGADA